MKKIPELLAPAGNMDALKAAINAGADAVYLAGKRFGARHYAANFDDEEIKEAVNFAHLRGVKVYVTVNTLIKDSEIKELSKYLIFLYKSGIDAILVQDIGVASLARKIVPQLKLHASTQMTIHNTTGVKWASEMGFKRVVLAREMELSEIQEIGEHINSEEIQLEIFAHGALCYSYSGQCLISSVIGGRSGNRGMCAQPCRRQYDLVFGEKDEFGKPVKLSVAPLKNKYLLSTRDLALYEHLNKIIKLNVSSLKIEGRMRSPEYVATVINIYRNALDSLAKGKWKPEKNKINALKLAFNRDFTGGYILEKDYAKVMGRNHPGNRGIYLGSLIKYNKKTKEADVKIKEEIILQKGDGIVFRENTNQKDYGMSIDKSLQIKKNRAKFKVSRYLNPGTPVYLTRSKSILEESQKIINRHQNKLKNEIIVDLHILIENNGTININSDFNSLNGHLKLKMTADFKMEKALKRPLEEEIVIKQFKKTGNTPFKVGNIKIEYPGNLFAPIGELNKIRRELFEKIEEMIISSSKPSKTKIIKANEKLDVLNKEFSLCSDEPNEKNLYLNAYVDNLEVLKSAVDAGCNKIYFNPFNLYNPNKCDFQSKAKIDELLELITKAIDICKEKDAEFVLALQKITSDDFLNKINPLLIYLFKSGVNKVMVDGVGASNFILNLNPEFKIFGSSGLNIWNTESVHTLKGYFNGFTISPELSCDEIHVLASNVRQRKINTELELMVQGNLDSLISKDCLPCLIGDEFLKNEVNDNIFLGIKDVKKHVFPLKLDNECRTIISNSVELSLIDYMDKVCKIPIDSISLNLEGRSKKYTLKICSIYKDAIKTVRNTDDPEKKLFNMKKEVKKISLGGITTGNFIKGTAKR